MPAGTLGRQSWAARRTVGPPSRPHAAAAADHGRSPSLPQLPDGAPPILRVPVRGTAEQGTDHGARRCRHRHLFLKKGKRALWPLTHRRREPGGQAAATLPPTPTPRVGARPARAGRTRAGLRSLPEAPATPGRCARPSLAVGGSHPGTLLSLPTCLPSLCLGTRTRLCTPCGLTRRGGLQAPVPGLSLQRDGCCLSRAPPAPGLRPSAVLLGAEDVKLRLLLSGCLRLGLAAPCGAGLSPPSRRLRPAGSVPLAPCPVLVTWWEGSLQKPAVQADPLHPASEAWGQGWTARDQNPSHQACPLSWWLLVTLVPRYSE